MESPDDAPATHPSEVALQGVVGAADRYRRAREAEAGTDTAARLSVPLAEALWWARALEEQLEDWESYKDRRRSDSLGQVMIGIRYARNPAGHQRSGSCCLTGPGSRFRFACAPASVTTSGGNSPTYRQHRRTSPDHKGQEAYAGLLAGQPVSNTLDDAEAWFRKVLHVPAHAEPA